MKHALDSPIGYLVPNKMSESEASHHLRTDCCAAKVAPACIQDRVGASRMQPADRTILHGRDHLAKPQCWCASQLQLPTSLACHEPIYKLVHDVQ